MTHFMIFGPVAVNMDDVRLMTEEHDGVTMHQANHPLIYVRDITIDAILTAMAAGQSRVLHGDEHATVQSVQLQGEPMAKITNAQVQGRRSARYREPDGNDAQAMRSIGRR